MLGSNLDRATSFNSWHLQWVSSTLSDECRDITLIRLWLLPSKSFEFTSPSTIWRHIVLILKESLYNSQIKHGYDSQLLQRYGQWFLEHELSYLVEDVLLTTHIQMYFQHVGTPSINQSTSDGVLNWHSPGRWICRSSPENWPPRSPNFSDSCIRRGTWKNLCMNARWDICHFFYNMYVYHMQIILTSPSHTSVTVENLNYVYRTNYDIDLYGFNNSDSR
jgi:hypothetical protein